MMERERGLADRGWKPLEPAGWKPALRASTLDSFPKTRPSLLSRLKNWQDPSWEEFCDIYSKLIRGFALKAGLSHSEAQDALQETLATVAKKLKADETGKPAFRYDPAIGSFRGWLLRTTRWKIGDQFRKRGPQLIRLARSDSRTNRTSPEERIPDPAGDNLEAHWDEEYLRSLYEKALEKVKRSTKAKHYQVFDLYVVKEWPAEKVARMLGINSAQVFLAKHRILGSIKKEVQRLEKEIV